MKARLRTHVQMEDVFVGSFRLGDGEGAVGVAASAEHDESRNFWRWVKWERGL